MPSIYQLKPAFQNLLRPLVERLYCAGVTANQVTLCAMLVSLLVAAFLGGYLRDKPGSACWLLFPGWMLVRMAFNAIDGMLAREYGQQSRLGAYYNELCDVISDTALYLCLLATPLVSPPLLLLTTFLALLSEYAGVMAPLVGSARRYDGPMGKSDRAFWFGLITVLLVLAPLFGLSDELMFYVCNGLLLVISLLLLLTLVNRVRRGVSNAGS